MKRKFLMVAGLMFAASTMAVAAGMGAGASGAGMGTGAGAGASNMSATDKAAIHNKVSTMSAADKAAMRSSMGAGNVGGAGMNHGTGSMGKGAMAGHGTHGTAHPNHDAAQHAAMQNTATTTAPVPAQ